MEMVLIKMVNLTQRRAIQMKVQDSLSHNPNLIMFWMPTKAEIESDIEKVTQFYEPRKTVRK